MSEDERRVLELGVGVNELRDIIHANAIDKGFWSQHKEVGTLLMLVVSELGEALEADRKDNRADIAGYENHRQFSPLKESEDFKVHIKDTFEDEIADSVIRLLDMCGGLGIDIGWHISKKMAYNSGRERLHGKGY